MLRPSNGNVEIDGIDITALKESQLPEIRALKIGFIFQSYNLLSRTTALENVELPLVYDRTGRFSNSRTDQKSVVGAEGKCRISRMAESGVR